MNKLTLHYFGCSFTNAESSFTGYEFTNFRKIIEEKINCNSKNYSENGMANQHIFDKVYKISKTENVKDSVFVIQTTFLNRLGMHCDLDNNFISMCKIESPDSQIDNVKINFYNDWLKYFYSNVTQHFEFEKEVDCLASWLKQNNIQFIFIGMDGMISKLDKSFFERNNFTIFDDKEFAFYPYAASNKLRIADVLSLKENNGHVDFHFNQLGHNRLAEGILRKIKFV